jgi:hypothetical protein
VIGAASPKAVHTTENAEGPTVCTTSGDDGKVPGAPPPGNTHVASTTIAGPEGNGVVKVTVVVPALLLTVATPNL